MRNGWHELLYIQFLILVLQNLVILQGALLPTLKRWKNKTSNSIYPEEKNEDTGFALM